MFLLNDASAAAAESGNRAAARNLQYRADRAASIAYLWCGGWLIGINISPLSKQSSAADSPVASLGSMGDAGG